MIYLQGYCILHNIYETLIVDNIYTTYCILLKEISCYRVGVFIVQRLRVHMSKLQIC